MYFHEKPIHTDGDGCACQDGHQFALPIGYIAGSAWELYTVGGVKQHRAPQLAHNGQAAHVHHQVVVAKLVPRSVRHMSSLPVEVTLPTACAMSSGAMNCPFLMLTGTPLSPAASSRSVCLLSSAGICSMCSISAAADTCHASCTSEITGT